MALIVQKYGGTSVADPDRIAPSPSNVAFTKRHGNDVVVVVSAMGKTTDNLIALANAVSPHPARPRDGHAAHHRRAHDRWRCCAWRSPTSASRPISFTGSQVGIITDTVHRKAKILEVKGDRVREALAAGKVCVVAGFQGVSTDKEITTLGRGGSDPPPSALAAGARAPTPARSTPTSPACSPPTRASCPRPASSPRSTSTRCSRWPAPARKVLALRSVEFARNHNVPLHVRSSFTWEPGTWVTNEEPCMEDPIISGVVTDMSEAKVTVLGVPDRPGISAALFEPLADANVNVDMIVQNTSTDGTTDISFTMPKADMGVAEEIVARVAARDRRRPASSHDDDIAKVSLVGAGMKTGPGIAAKMFRVLADEGVNIEMISTSTIRISIVCSAGDLERAARALHTAFGLDSGPTTPPRSPSGSSRYIDVWPSVHPLRVRSELGSDR